MILLTRSDPIKGICDSLYSLSKFQIWKENEKHSGTFPTCEILLALNLEEGILDPACSIGKLPDGVDVFDAGLVGAVGQPAAEGAHLRAYHPQASGSASHIE